jgi:hypothetical protein
MTQHYDDALHVMELQGGSFVKSLAHCYCMADPESRLKLRQAFAKYFDEYEGRFAEWREGERAAERLRTASGTSPGPAPRPRRRGT